MHILAVNDTTSIPRIAYALEACNAANVPRPPAPRPPARRGEPLDADVSRLLAALYERLLVSDERRQRLVHAFGLADFARQRSILKQQR